MFYNENILCTKKVQRIRVAAAETPKQCIAGVSDLWVKVWRSVCDSLELNVESVKMHEVSDSFPPVTSVPTASEVKIHHVTLPALMNINHQRSQNCFKTDFFMLILYNNSYVITV